MLMFTAHNIQLKQKQVGLCNYSKTEKNRDLSLRDF